MSDPPPFRSTKEAIAYALRHHQGPSLSQPRYNDAPRGFRCPWLGVGVMAVLVGKKHVGITAEEWPQIRAWALHGQPRTPRVEAIYRRAQRALRRHGYVDPPRLRRGDVLRSTYTDADGLTHGSMAALHVGDVNT